VRHTLAGRAETVIQAKVLMLLRDNGPLSRIQIADRLGVSRTTVAAEVGRLHDLGLAQEVGLAESRGGRRSALVDLSPDTVFAGISIGATGFSVGLTDGRLNVTSKEHVECDIRAGAQSVISAALDVTRSLLDKAGGPVPLGAGVAVPGPVDFDRGIPVAPPLMPGWDGYPVRDVVSRELGCTAILDNDVNAMALGEGHAGVAKNTQDFLFVKIGTGIGCGIVVGGEIFRGVDGCAGDIGHIRVADDGPVCACGNVGCLEALAGGAALAREARAAAESDRSQTLARMLGEQGELTAIDVGRAVAEGDAAALVILRDCGRRVGEVLASLVSFFNPGMIVIGGRVAGLGHALLAEIRGVTYRRSLPLATRHLPVVVSELGDDSGPIGAARLVSDAIYASYRR
jgi:glucokinase-like ROK family protein